MTTSAHNSTHSFAHNLISDAKIEINGTVIDESKVTSGRGFLSTLVKKTALNKTVAPKGHDGKLKAFDAEQSEPHYQNYSDIIQNMSQKNPMSMKDMRLLQDNIKKLDQEAHIEICRMLVEDQENKEALRKARLVAKQTEAPGNAGNALGLGSGKVPEVGDTQAKIGDTQAKIGDRQANIGDTQAKIGDTQAIEGGDDAQMPEFTVNNYGTYFDLVDLSSELLWKIHYYVNLSLEDMERQKIKVAAQKQWDQDQADNPQYQKMKHQHGKDRSQNIFHQALPSYSVDNLPSYEDLREDALRNLKQSHQPIMSNLRDEETSEDYDNPDSVRLGTEVVDEGTELGDEPSELDDFD